MKDSSNTFTLTEEQYDETSCYIRAVGRLSAIESDALQERLEWCLQEGRINIILNMYKVSYMSSAGIRVLLSTFKKAKQLGGKFRVDNPSENVMNVLGMTALDEMLLV